MNSAPKHPEIAKQFTALLDALDITAGRLAKDISVPGEVYSQQLINNYVLGKVKPKPAVLAAIQRKYPAVDVRWLLTGQGEPFPNGRFTQQAQTLTVVAEEMPAPYSHHVAAQPLQPEVLREVMGQLQRIQEQHAQAMTRMEERHKEEINRARKDCRTTQKQIVDQYQAIMNNLDAKIHHYEGLLGLRPLTPEEQQAREAQKNQPPQPAGFRPSSVYQQPEACHHYSIDGRLLLDKAA